MALGLERKTQYSRVTHQALIVGVASFPLRMKIGNKQANKHPLKEIYLRYQHRYLYTHKNNIYLTT